MSTVFMIMPKLIIFVMIIFLILFVGIKIINNLVKDYRENKYRKFLLKVSVLIMGVFLFQYGINNLNRNRLPRGNDVAIEYIIELNQTKTSNSGTKVKINKLLLDLNTIDFNIGVKGKDKVVAVEIKKSSQDIEALKEFTGLYIGKRSMYEYNLLGMGIEENQFLDPIYIICYLSNGEELSYKIDDVKNARNHVKVIEINKKLKENPQIILNKVTKGVSHTSIDLTSDINLFDLEVTILDGNEEYNKLSGSGSGGLIGYYGPPIKTKDVKIKVKIKYSKEEFIIPLEI